MKVLRSYSFLIFVLILSSCDVDDLPNFYDTKQGCYLQNMLFTDNYFDNFSGRFHFWAETNRDKSEAGYYHIYGQIYADASTYNIIEVGEISFGNIKVNMNPNNFYEYYYIYENNKTKIEDSVPVFGQPSILHIDGNANYNIPQIDEEITLCKEIDFIDAPENGDTVNISDGLDIKWNSDGTQDSIAIMLSALSFNYGYYPVEFCLPFKIPDSGYFHIALNDLGIFPKKEKISIQIGRSKEHIIKFQSKSIFIYSISTDRRQVYFR